MTQDQRNLVVKMPSAAQRICYSMPERVEADAGNTNFAEESVEVAAVIARDLPTCIGLEQRKESLRARFQNCLKVSFHTQFEQRAMNRDYPDRVHGFCRLSVHLVYIE